MNGGEGFNTVASTSAGGLRNR